MTVRTRTIIVSALSLIFVFATLCFFAWPHIQQVAKGPASSQITVSEEIPACYDEVKDERDLEKVIRVGNGYFGGERGYDLRCVRVAFDRAIALDPTGYTLSWYQLGRVDFIEGDFDNAIFKFNKQIELFGEEHPNVYYMRGLTYGYRARATENPEDWLHAEKDFSRFIELDPYAPWPRVDLAWVFFSQGKYEEMKPVLEGGLLVVPEQPWLLNMYGLALLNTGDAPGAALFFKDALYLAKKLTPQEWGAAYPGNDPNVWPVGLAQMIASIEKNISLTEAQAGS